MKNKYLVLAGNNKIEKGENILFLFPLKGFCVGMTREYSIEEIPDGAYVYLNRIFDTFGIEEFEHILPMLEEKAKAIVFEDLGVLEVLQEKKSSLKTILYATHALCSLSSVKAYLNVVDTVILSADLTLEEVDSIANETCVGSFAFGLLPVMYSRRKLISNYAKHFGVSVKNPFLIEEPIHHRKFLLVENDYGTVLYDYTVYNGYELLACPCSFYLLDFEHIVVDDFSLWIEEFEAGKNQDKSTGFLHQETIYLLPPKEDKK